MIRTVATKPFADQKPGTSGLRKKVPIFRQPAYLENFIQSIFDSLEDFSGKTLVVGGDGRFFNREAIQVVAKMAAANGFGRIVIGRGGILSTPAVSALIRHIGAFGGIILSASHNPGGPEGDFGVKYNISAGGPAPEHVTDAIFARTKEIDAYEISDAPDVDIDRLGTVKLEGATVEIVDPVTQYLALMKTLFDFDAIRALFASGFRIRFDGMHAVTGPYAHAIFESELGAAKGTVVNGTPLPDFGGHHPDPNLDLRQGSLRSVDGAAGARFRRGLRRRRRPQPHPRAGHLRDALGFAGDPGRQRHARAGLRQGARGRRALDADQRRASTGSRPSSASRPTRPPRAGNSSAICSTPGLATLCGEESFGTGSNHIREKDGVWAVLFWLNILARRRMSGIDLVREHWATYGRNYYTRHDYDEIDLAAAQAPDDGAARRDQDPARKNVRRAQGRSGGRLRVP